MTKQQERFAIEYASSGNATQAAKNAGYSEATAYSQGQRLLKNVEVAEMINSIKVQLAEDLRSEMVREASTAFNVLTSIMKSSEARDGDKIKCAIDVLDRAGYAAEKKLALRTNEDKSLDRLRQDMAYDDLRIRNGADTE